MEQDYQRHLELGANLYTISCLGEERPFTAGKDNEEWNRDLKTEKWDWGLEELVMGYQMERIWVPEMLSLVQDAYLAE